MLTTGSGGRDGDRPGRTGRAHRRRATPAAGQPGLASTGRPGVHACLVDLAATPSSHRSTYPLPATTQETATVGLVLRSLDPVGETSAQAAGWREWPAPDPRPGAGV